MNFQYSDKGLALTKRFEGLRLRAYQDSGKTWTIGWGHTGPDVNQNKRITLEEATALLVVDAAKAADAVNKQVNVKINQNQFDALVDFVYNLGTRNFAISMLLRYVNAGDFASAADQFKHWTKVKGVVVEGLAERRAAERALFALDPEPITAEPEAPVVIG